MLLRQWTPHPLARTPKATWIQKQFNIPIGLLNVIKRVVTDVRECASNGGVYEINKTVSNRLKLTAVKPNSVEALIITELMEDGAEICWAHKEVLV
jgi:hypothetical protein